MEKFGLYYDIFDRKVGKYEGKITFCGRNRQKHDKIMNVPDNFPQCGIAVTAQLGVRRNCRWQVLPTRTGMWGTPYKEKKIWLLTA